MAANGIIGCGAYIPKRRMSRAALYDAIGWAQPSLKSFAKGVRAFAGWDEDAVTLAVDAARGALVDVSARPAQLCFASTTAPFLDRLNAGVVAAALDLPDTVHRFDAAGSQRAATSALIGLLKGQADVSLLAAGEKRPLKAASALEMTSADAGAAVLVGPKAPIAEVVGVKSVGADFVDHYRTASSVTDYVLEERWHRDEGLGRFAQATGAALLAECGVEATSIDSLIAPTPNPSLARAVAGAVGVRPEAIADSMHEACGQAGAAHPLLMLALALETAKPGALVLLLGFGQGCDAILLRTTALIESRRPRSVSRSLNDQTAEQNYTRFLSAGGRLDIDWGMRAERDNRTAQTVAFNKSRDIYGFVGGRCEACATPQFPKSRRCVNPDCSALDTQTDYRFAERHGRIKSFTEDWLAFTRDPPLLYGNVDFEGGGAAFMEMSGFAPGEAKVGAEVEMAFRIKDFDRVRGFHRYFWKAVPRRHGAAHG